MTKKIKKPYRVAILGLGKIASRYQEDPLRKGIVTHAAAYKDNPRCRLVAGYDPSPHQRRRFESHWNIAAYDDLDRLFAEQSPDLVSICSPPETHAFLLEYALRQKVKGILCEKPLAMSRDEGQKLKGLFEGKKTVVSLNVSRRWDRMHQQIARDIQQKKWGDLQLVNAYYTGSLRSTGAHLLDGLRMLVGEVKSVQALPPYALNPDFGVNAWMQFRSGAVAFLHALPEEHYLLYEMDFYLTKARLRLADNGFGTEFWKVADSRQFTGFRSLRHQKTPYPPGYRNVLENAVEDLVACVDRSQKPLCTLEDGLASLSIQEALLQSVRHNGRRVYL